MRKNHDPTYQNAPSTKEHVMKTQRKEIRTSTAGVLVELAGYRNSVVRGESLRLLEIVGIGREANLGCGITREVQLRQTAQDRKMPANWSPTNSLRAPLSYVGLRARDEKGRITAALYCVTNTNLQVFQQPLRFSQVTPRPAGSEGMARRSRPHEVRGWRVAEPTAVVS